MLTAIHDFVLIAENQPPLWMAFILVAWGSLVGLALAAAAILAIGGLQWVRRNLGPTRDEQLRSVDQPGTIPPRTIEEREQIVAEAIGMMRR